MEQKIQPFIFTSQEQPLRETPSSVGERVTPKKHGTWHLYAAEDIPVGKYLRSVIELLPGIGMIVCLPNKLQEEDLALLLNTAKQTLRQCDKPFTFVLLHQGVGASFARSLYLEAQGEYLRVCVIKIPGLHPLLGSWLLEEVLAADGYTESTYDATGTRYEPLMRTLPIVSEESPIPLSPDDILLVTGGGRGITMHCVLALAQETGVRVVLVDLLEPSVDTELISTIQAFHQRDLSFRYFYADVTHAESMRLLIQEIEATWGKITGIIHGAGINRPQYIRTLQHKDMLATVAPKALGLQNVLQAIENQEQLKLLVTFGSILSHTGLSGNSDYAIANELLAQITEEAHIQNPQCRCLCVEWSIWSQIGMAARMAHMDAIQKMGFTPIPPQEGVQQLLHVIRSRTTPTRVAITGSLGNLLR